MENVRFWVQEVQNREEDGVQDGEEEVGTPADLLDEHGSDHDDEEVPDPAASNVSLLSYTIDDPRQGTYLEVVDNALAFALVFSGLISAGYSHGRGSQVAPKKAM